MKVDKTLFIYIIRRVIFPDMSTAWIGVYRLANTLADTNGKQCAACVPPVAHVWVQCM